jgi:hypothetical protein
MQNTRLSNLVSFLASQLQTWINNPWRRSSIWLIALLLGNFLGSAITSSAGQLAQWDVVASLIVLTITELVSWLTYRRRNPTPLGVFGWDTLNALKLGLVYSMFLESFKLGS